MTERDLASFTAADLDDPRCDATTIAQLAQGRPDLWGAIRRHPKCYPALAAWIDRQLPPAPDVPAASPVSAEAPASRAPVKPTAEEWAARFQQETGREPSMSEYQAALANGEIRRSQDASVQQMTAGAKQLATGAKEFFGAHVAPAAKSAVRSVQQSVQEQRRAQPISGSGSRSAPGWAPIALPIAAFLAAVSLFLPIASGGGYAVNYFHREAEGQGAVLLTLMLLLVGVATTALVIRAKWARIAAGVVGVLVGLAGVLWGAAPMFGASGYSGYGISIGAGAVLLLVFSVAAVVAGVVTLLGLRRPAAAPSVPQPQPQASWPAQPSPSPWPQSRDER